MGENEISKNVTDRHFIIIYISPSSKHHGYDANLHDDDVAGDDIEASDRGEENPIFENFPTKNSTRQLCQ